MGRAALSGHRCEQGNKRPKSQVRIIKTKALWAMKGAKVCHDPAHKRRHFGKKKGNLNDPISAMDKALSAWRTPAEAGHWLEASSGKSGGLLQKKLNAPFWEGGLALLGSVGQCTLAHSVHLPERSREVWAAWRTLFLLYSRKGRWWLRTTCRPTLVSAESLKACTLIGLHFWAAEGEACQVVVSLLT